MKLVKAIKKSKKNGEAAPPMVSEKPPIITQTPPLVAKASPVVPHARPIIAEMPSARLQAEIVAPKAAPVKAVVPASPVTTIEAKINVGFGNHLFLRGQGAGLSWERGAPLKCVDAQTWRWSAPAAEPLTFKLLLNDKVWAQGEDIVVAPGKCVGVAPRF
jgi:hypothetical protein